MSAAWKLGVKKVEAHADSIWSSCYTSRGDILTGSLDGTVQVRDGSDLSLKSSTASRHKFGATSVIATHDCSKAIACYQDSTIKFYAMNDTLEEIDSVDAGLFEAYTLCLSPDDDVLVGGSSTGKANFWSMKDGHEKVSSVDIHENKAILSIAFNHDFKLATSAIDGVVNIFDLEKQQVIHKIEAHALPCRSVVFSPGGHLLYTASDDKHANVFDTLTGQLVGSFSHAGMCYSIDRSSDERHFAVGNADSSVTVWDLGMQRDVGIFDNHTESVWSVKFDPTDDTGRRFLSTGEDSSIQLYE